MIHKLFTIYDSKVDYYEAPMMSQTTASGLRMFGDMVQQCQTPKPRYLALHPADYGFFEIGEFDDANATITMLAMPVHLAVASEFIDEG